MTSPYSIQLTPTERLALLILAAVPNQTAEQIFKLSGGKTYSHLKVALRSLCLAGRISATLSPAGITTYALAAE